MTTEKFLSHTHRRGECLLWEGPVRVWVDGRAVRPVRAALLLSQRYPRREGDVISCTCGTPSCVATHHLEWVTRKEWGKRHLENLTATRFGRGPANPRWKGGHGQGEK